MSNITPQDSYPVARVKAMTAKLGWSVEIRKNYARIVTGKTIMHGRSVFTGRADQALVFMMGVEEGRRGQK